MSPPLHLRRLREVVADHETQRLGRRVRGDDVVVTSGSQQALTSWPARDPGDPVLVEDPCYVGALQVFQTAGARLHPVPVDSAGLDVDGLIGMAEPLKNAARLCFATHPAPVLHEAVRRLATAWRGSRSGAT